MSVFRNENKQSAQNFCHRSSVMEFHIMASHMMNNGKMDVENSVTDGCLPLNGICDSISVNTSLAAASLFLWVEESGTGRVDEFVTLSLGVNWRDASVGRAASMKLISDSNLAENTERLAPVVLTYDALHVCGLDADSDSPMCSPGASIQRESAPATRVGKMNSLFTFFELEEKGDTTSILQKLSTLLEFIADKLSDSAENVFLELRKHLEHCCMARLVEALNQKGGDSSLKSEMQAKDASVPLVKLWPKMLPLDCMHGEINMVEDHPLKSVSLFYY